VLTRLGAPATPEDAVGLLLECHVRIRTFLAMAARVAAAGPAERDGLAEAAARVARYFREALPLHARDEEESILPRLRGREPALDDALAEMASEHAAHGPPMAALIGACEALARDPSRHDALAPALAGAAAELEAHFATHLQREEAVIFPAMRRLLSREEDAAVVRELRARRGA
jgi:hemerythrin-like domain-containing protein